MRPAWTRLAGVGVALVLLGALLEHQLSRVVLLAPSAAASLGSAHRAVSAAAAVDPLQPSPFVSMSATAPLAASPPTSGTTAAHAAQPPTVSASAAPPPTVSASAAPPPTVSASAAPPPTVSASAAPPPTVSASAALPPTVSASGAQRVNASALTTRATTTAPQALRRHCGGVAPIAGRMDLSTPPYFFPELRLCPVPPVFSPEGFLGCMARRRGRIFFLGNSFARGMGFTLAAHLNGISQVNRGAQKKTCAKVRDVVGARTDGYADQASCKLNVTVPSALSGSVDASDSAIRILWRSMLNNTDLHRDFCYSLPPASCYSDFFENSRPGDVLITTVGMDYVLGVKGVPDVAAWTIRDIDAFLDARWFKGTLVWMTLFLGHPALNWASFSPTLDAMNDVLIPAMRARGVTVIDLRRFGADLAPDALYVVDAIHPRDEVYAAALFHAFAAVCDDDTK